MATGRERLGGHSPRGYTLVRGKVSGMLLPLGFLIIIPGATDERSPTPFAPL